jgi:hypothetical protein
MGLAGIGINGITAVISNGIIDEGKHTIRGG